MWRKLKQKSYQKDMYIFRLKRKDVQSVKKDWYKIV